ncbi:DNA internalization-related competence protein ComEC/Rec2 [Pseudodesulfovibrio sp. zrk46]|uniref:DNA internalization-related competence protein ComEC/Rec2 n=1 Tax=Pseudodesulfovibrio sp. zrk46 TaxID=2725288 RepID=UPI001449AABC|nr:DNA internalization-related competence protein ComEC/Rec2 [Pseudodesulfovibrio sp. zrk46]QJB58255.1 DNA internalization-related competence protein ComEC/Rec2 [Pseudodesulfovibrio sp. zrk46]
MTVETVRPAPAPVPGLLPWQTCFLAIVLGIFAYRYPVPALTSLGVLYIADTVIRGWLRRLPWLAVVLCAAFGFGYAAQVALVVPEVPVWVEARQSVDLQAVVDRADPRPEGRLRLVLRDIQYEVDGQAQTLTGKLAWTWRNPEAFPVPGQAVSLRMRVMPVRNFGNPGAWDYEWYWQRQGVMWRGWPAGRDVKPVWGQPPSNALWELKMRLRKAVVDHLPATQGGAMVRALITGDRSGLEAATAEATRSAGLAHTLALSGLHVGFVAAMGWGLAWLLGWVYPPMLLRIPRPKLAVWLAAPLVLGYAWLGQPSQSLLRAATMFAFWGFLLLQGRGRVLIDGLFFALAIIVFVSPFSVFDLSLQMSAVAVAGIGLMYPLIRGLFCADSSWWMRGLSWAGGLLAVSLCANVALLSLVSWNFGTWSPNILFNLVWLPVLGVAVMPLGVVGMVLSLMSWTAPLGRAALSFAASIMDWLLGLLHIAGEVEMAPVFSVLRPLWPEIVGVALLLIVTILAWANRRVFLGLAGIGFFLMVWPHISVMIADSQDHVSLTTIDVGLGQAQVISTPGGHRWLVDGGPGTNSFDLGESVVAPYLTYGRPPRLDGVFLSHPDTDHSHGLPFVLSRFDVGAFYSNGMSVRGRTGERLRKVFEDKPELVAQPLRAGQIVSLSDDVNLEVLHPSEGIDSRRGNERSLVMRLMRQRQPLALIPGDVEGIGLDVLLASDADLSAQILVLPHHGSRSSYSPEFYSQVSPEAAVGSDGYLNRYGFPHRQVVSGVGVPVYTTSRHGLIRCIWDEENELSIRAFRP